MSPKVASIKQGLVKTKSQLQLSNRQSIDVNESKRIKVIEQMERLEALKAKLLNRSKQAQDLIDD